MKRAAVLACLALASGSAALPVRAGSAEDSAQGQDAGKRGGELRVGVYVDPPFVARTGGEGYAGMAIELWEIAARDLQWRYRYEEVGSYEELVDGLESGSLDVGVANIAITRERAGRMDFTHPWYDAGMRVMAPKAGKGSGLLGGMREGGHLRVYAVLGFAMLVATLLLTLADRKNDRKFTRHWGEGLAENFYRVVCGVALVAYIASSTFSVMSVDVLSRQINDVRDLEGRPVGVAAGSAAERFAIDTGLTPVRYRGMEEAARLLARGDVAAIVGDAPLLEYYAHAYPEAGLEVVGRLFNPDKYGFVMRHGSALQKPLAIRLLRLREGGQLEALRSRYFDRTGG
ncbi:transporter substrate-binding domain-containing protein [Pseudoxanthomonas putridarboris]|uniref:Transporter substrate-binding domain-containing protein n=1 Tax=Pseudoxanthomonas putridarboris TaxID=752605 RepID=A0ABU9J3T3_9GAMM